MEQTRHSTMLDRGRWSSRVLLGWAGLTLALFLLLGAWRPAPPPPGDLLASAGALGAQWVGRPLPPFDLQGNDGRRVTSQELMGQPVLIHFWASWCPTCLPELPLFQELDRKFASRGLRQLHISLDEERELARRSLPGGWQLPVAYDPQGQVAHAFGTEKLPEAYLVDARGQVVLRFVANQPWLDPRLQDLLQAALR